MVGHRAQLALAGAEHLGDRPDVLLGDVDGEELGRLVQLAVDLAGDHLGLADGQFERLAAHRLHQHGELQLATTLHLPGVGALGRVDPDRHVADQLALQAGLEQPGGEVLAGPAGQRGGVDADRHRDRRLVDGDQRQRPGILRVGQGLADGDLGDARDGDDVAGAGGLGRDPLERLGHQQLGELDVLDGAVAPAPGHRLALAQLALLDPAQRQPAEVGRRVEVGDVRLQQATLLVRGGRDGVEDRLEQRLQVGGVGHPAVLRLGQRGPAGLGRRVHHREVEDRPVGVLGQQVHEEVVGLLEHLLHPGVGAVDLVDHDDQRQPLGQRLAQHEPGLRQRAFRGVDQQHHAVHHLQAALDLAAEVGVAGGVDDVDGDVLALDHVLDRSVLGQDRDALLPLQVHRVHDAVVHVLTLPEGAGLPQHGIDKGGLAVVDVGDDGDVAQVRALGHMRDFRCESRSTQMVVPPGGTA
ncbi:hypothetical protein SDC9_102863 [bioreactor metagenome]|uniref:NAD-specific glutamate dehydrogenase n=1 Tax=bioreactor metagenome TaxID=1076179 RepID=A0A645B2X1_9ZZZZ